MDLAEIKIAGGHIPEITWYNHATNYQLLGEVAYKRRIPWDVLLGILTQFDTTGAGEQENLKNGRYYSANGSHVLVTRNSLRTLTRFARQRKVMDFHLNGSTPVEYTLPHLYWYINTPLVDGVQGRICLFIRVGARLYSWPFGNVYRDGRICWGHVSVDLKQTNPQYYHDLFFSTAFNADLRSVMPVKKDLRQMVVAMPGGYGLTLSPEAILRNPEVASTCPHSAVSFDTTSQLQRLIADLPVIQSKPVVATEQITPMPPEPPTPTPQVTMAMPEENGGMPTITFEEAVNNARMRQEARDRDRTRQQQAENVIFTTTTNQEEPGF